MLTLSTTNAILLLLREDHNMYINPEQKHQLIYDLTLCFMDCPESKSILESIHQDETKAIKKVARYFEVWVDQLEAFPSLHGIAKMGVDRVNKSVGRVRSNTYIAYLLKPLSFYTLVTEGFKGRGLSEITVHPRYRNIISNYITQETLMPTQTNVIHSDDPLIIQVNLDFDYMESVLSDSYNRKELTDQTQRDLDRILSQAPDGVLIQRFAQTKGSRSRRLYTHRKSLQNVTREARKLLVPSHSTIDINTSVFAIMYAVYLSLFEQNGVKPHTLVAVEDYIKNKDSIRESVAKKLFPKMRYATQESYAIKVVKQAYTAIGFGARVQKTPSYFFDDNGNLQSNALHDILHDRTSDFIKISRVAAFIEEYKLMTDVIYEFMRNSPLVLSDDLVIAASDDVTKSQRLAYFYQSLERQCLDLMYQTVSTVYGPSGVYALLHDGIMTQLLSSRDSVELNYVLNQLLNNSLRIRIGELDYTLKTNWITVSIEHENPTEPINDQQHRDNIALEERMAKFYKPQNG